MRRAWEQISAAAKNLWGIETQMKFGFNVPWFQFITASKHFQGIETSHTACW